jgi:hypothetical protein
MKSILVLMACFTLGAGCASAPIATTMQTRLCLPPKVSSALFTWPVVSAHPAGLQTEEGNPAPAIVVRFEREGSATLVVWSRSGLLYVDPSPDSDAPAWVNRQLLTPQGFLRSHPAGGCEWRRGGQES